MVNPSWSSFQKNKEKPSSPPLNSVQSSPIPSIEKNVKEENQVEEPGEVKDALKPEGEKPQWGNFQSPTTYQGPIDEEQEESTFGYLARNISAGASRLVEGIVGLPGNAERLTSDLLSSYPKAFGLFPWALSEYLGEDEWKKRLSSQVLPTSQGLKEVSESLTSGYTKPKTKGESRFQDYVSDIGSTFLTRGLPNLRNLAVNHIGIPIAANLGKDALEAVGFKEDKQNLGKLGIWIGLALAGNVNAPQHASNLMNQGRNGMPQTANIDVPRLQQSLQRVSNSPQLLNADPRSALARQSVSAIERDIANGQSSVRSLMTTYDGLNAAKRDAGLFGMSAGDKRFAVRAINEVRDAVRDEIIHAGSAHPQALQSWRSGVQAWATIHQSDVIKNFAQSLAKSPYAKILTGPAAGLFGISTYAAKQHPAIATTLGVGGAVANKNLQVLYRAANNPDLARYYGEAISAAAAENVPAFINNYNKLNEGLKKSESIKVDSKRKK